MPIPLRELAIVILLVTAALGMEITCLRAYIKLDAVQADRTFITRQMLARGSLTERSSCNEESMLVGWDVQLRMQAERRENEAAPQAAKVTYESASL